MKVDIAELNRVDSHKLMLGIIVPRPVTLVSTIGSNGVFNVAPFSSVAMACFEPAVICFGVNYRDGQKKDTLRNIEYSRDFVVNVVDEALAEAMIKTAADFPSGVDEFQVAGLTAIASDRVESPRVKESPISLECKLHQILQFGEMPNLRNLIFGQILLAHIDDELYSEGKISPFQLKSIGHFAGNFYCRTRDIFEMKRLP